MACHGKSAWELSSVPVVSFQQWRTWKWWCWRFKQSSEIQNFSPRRSKPMNGTGVNSFFLFFLQFFPFKFCRWRNLFWNVYINSYLTTHSCHFRKNNISSRRLRMGLWVTSAWHGQSLVVPRARVPGTEQPYCCCLNLEPLPLGCLVFPHSWRRQHLLLDFQQFPKPVPGLLSSHFEIFTVWWEKKFYRVIKL